MDEKVVDKAPWFAAVIRRNSFALAERSLRRQGLNVFAPKLVKPTVRFGKQVPLESLLFPGYIFVQDASNRMLWRAVRSTEGVARLVMGAGASPPEVPRGFIEGLQMRCNPSGQLVTGEDLEAGDDVSIVHGPFAGLVSTIEKIDEERRVWVLLELLGSTRSISIPASQLVRVRR